MISVARVDGESEAGHAKRAWTLAFPPASGLLTAINANTVVPRDKPMP